MNHKRKLNLKKQLACIYTADFFSGLRITDAVWVALLAALPLMAHVPAVSAAWLVIGGAAYTAGVVFFVMDAMVRYAHAVWHGCVIAGTGCHVIALLGLQTVT